MYDTHHFLETALCPAFAIFVRRHTSGLQRVLADGAGYNRRRLIVYGTQIFCYD